jgi:acetolactate synthase-1/2/3 large subunit
VEAARVWEPAQLREAYSRMLASRGPYVLDVIVDPEEDVYPMIPAGATFRDIILEKPAGVRRPTGEPVAVGK